MVGKGERKVWWERVGKRGVLCSDRGKQRGSFGIEAGSKFVLRGYIGMVKGNGRVCNELGCAQ